MALSSGFNAVVKSSIFLRIFWIHFLLVGSILWQSQLSSKGWSWCPQTSLILHLTLMLKRDTIFSEVSTGFGLTSVCVTEPALGI